MRPRRIGCVKTSRVSWQLTPPVLLRSLLRLLCWMLPPSTLSVSCVVIVGMGVLGSTSSPALVSARLVFATAAVLIVLLPVRSIATSGSFALSPTALRIFLHRPASSSLRLCVFISASPSSGCWRGSLLGCVFFFIALRLCLNASLRRCCVFISASLGCHFGCLSISVSRRSIALSARLLTCTAELSFQAMVYFGMILFLFVFLVLFFLFWFHSVLGSVFAVLSFCVSFFCVCRVFFCVALLCFLFFLHCLLLLSVLVVFIPFCLSLCFFPVCPFFFSFCFVFFFLVCLRFHIAGLLFPPSVNLHIATLNRSPCAFALSWAFVSDVNVHHTSLFVSFVFHSGLGSVFAVLSAHCILCFCPFCVCRILFDIALSHFVFLFALIFILSVFAYVFLGIFPCVLLPSWRLLLRSFFAYTCLRESWRRTALGLDALLLGASVEIVRELCEWASAEICRHYTNWSGFGASFVRSSSAVWRVCRRRCLTRMLWLFVMNCWIPALRRRRLSGFICLFWLLLSHFAFLGVFILVVCMFPFFSFVF